MNKESKENMSNKIIIINGSPRKNGNTSNVINWVKSAAIGEGAQVEIVDAVKLANQNSGCRGCRKCNESDEYRCVIRDDISVLITRMLERDVIVFATPVYFGSFPSQLKQFIDRMYCLKRMQTSGFTVAPALEKVSIVLIATSGASEEYGLDFMSKHMRAIFSGLGKDIEEFLIPSCPPEINEIKSNTDVQKKAIEFGRKLARKSHLRS